MSSNKSRGFAMLFVTITMGLLSLLISSVAAQNLMYNAQLRREFAKKRARYAALFALKVALARLQESAGVDGVISAKRNNVDSKIAPNGNTIGIWRTYKSEGQYRTEFLRWLAADYDSDNQHNVPKLQMRDADDTLHWDFAIHDESQKLDLSLQNTTNDNYVKLLCPQQSGYEQVFTIVPDKKHGAFERKNIDFLEQIELFDSKLWHEIANEREEYTLHSYAVLSGQTGLKTDLSTWMTGSNFAANEYIFAGDPALPAPPPTWKFLQSFCKLKDRRSSDGLPVAPTQPLHRPQYMVDYSQRTLANLGDDLGSATNHGIYPIVAQLDFSISAAFIGGELVIKIQPLFALWNPHSLPLQPTDYQLDALIFPQRSDAKICLTISGELRAPMGANHSNILELCSDETEQYLRRIFGLTFNCGFKAGEVKIFSIANDSDATPARITSAISGNYNNCLLLKTGLKASDYTKFTISCTDQNNIQNLNWNEFYIRLIHRPSQAILQEIAQLTPINSGQISPITAQPNDGEKLLLTLSTTMKVGLGEDAQTDSGIRWLAFANPRAPFVNRALFQDPASIFFGQECIPGNWSWNANFTGGKPSPDYQRLNFLNGLILFDIPHRDYGILNIAALQHANWTPFGYLPNACFGNSTSNPYMPANRTIFANASTGIWPSHNRVESLFDYSYLLNESLFDNFFCSTVHGTTEQKLANKRFKILGTKIEPATLLIKGNFNVHSTVEKAWIAYLASRFNGNGEVIFPRIYSQSTDQYASFSKYDVKNLAQSIVALVEQRSLFPVLSSFINRQPAENDDPGLLQRAILHSGINRNRSKHHIAFAKGRRWFSDAVASGYLEEGLPTTLSQADLLQGLAHFITVRGDTFRIVAIGTCANASARCEAIVQRMPAFVDPGKNSPEDTALAEVNKKLGRRFEVILFRWL
jgi:hypothetical protein